MRWITAFSVLAFWGCLVLGWAADENFTPELTQAPELISGSANQDARIPADAAELRAYPMPAGQALELLTQVPGKPFRPTTPAPLGRAYWKYPIYAALGLPRDAIDAMMGGLSYVPLLNIPLVYVPYELIPSQYLFRDSRDWHKWPGLRNERDHGMIDGSSWGWFSSAKTWHFQNPSLRKARKNTQYNEDLKKQLVELNRTRQTANQAIAAYTQETRAKTLAAIKAGNGKEAAQRMFPYHASYPLDEGAFALYATALALYAPEGPHWVGPALWNELIAAQPRQLEQAEKLLATTVQAFPERPNLAEALIYTRLLLGQPKPALATAQTLLKAQEGDPLRRRIVFETALAAADAATARAIFTAMKAENYDANDWQLMEARLNLLEDHAGPARQSLAALHEARPDDPYLNYYYAAALLATAEESPNAGEAYRQALGLAEKATLQAPNAFLRARANIELAYLRGVVAGVTKQPEAFTPATPAAPSAPATPAPATPPASAAPEKK